MFIPTIYIVSGEGERGTRVPYTGTPTARALRARLTRDRCGGDRWARVEIDAEDGGYREVGAEEAARIVDHFAGAYVHSHNGRWVVASWNSRTAQYTSGDHSSPAQGYCYTYARSIGGLVSEGIRTYRTRGEALRMAYQPGFF